MPIIDRQEIASLPATPGCYIYRDAAGKILYIGKSKNLHNRVAQYFQGKGDENPKIRRLVPQIVSVEYIQRETDIEAIFLEHRLIKQHRPTFNTKMNKDQSPTLLCIDINQERPGVYLAKSKAPSDGALCFRVFRWSSVGPNLVHLLGNVWRIPVCEKRYFKEPYQQPCMQYRLGKCAAPCSAAADMDEYRQTLADLCGFLRGENAGALDGLKAKMQTLANDCDFEQAAAVRDQINYFLDIQRYAEIGNFTFAGKKVCVFVKGYFEEAFILCYVEEEQIRLHQRFTRFADFTEDARRSLVRRIREQNWDAPDEELSISTLLEISAKRLFVDMTQAKNANALIGAMNEGFAKFHEA